MESDRIYAATPNARVGAQPLHPPYQAAALNPPASRQVFEWLSSYLTPPHSLLAHPGRTRSQGHYDTLAKNCASLESRPSPQMRWAYQACTDVIRHHSRSFYFSARLLPPGKREGIMSLYAFCRLSDDLVDGLGAAENHPVARARARLALGAWARENIGLVPASDHPVVVAWADTRRRFAIPQALADELVEGVRMDLTIDRYATWDELWLYCYRVASTVGLMSMYITGARTMDAVPYAVQLGVALQLTNILRDVGEDARAGRIYLPREDMERFGYTEDMLMSGVINDRFVSLMRFQIERAHALYRAAEPGIAMLPEDSRLAVSAASAVYRGILGKIVEANYDVFNHRAHLSMGEKLRALPSLWWRSKVNAPGLDS